jgi:hypothetical protein
MRCWVNLTKKSYTRSYFFLNSVHIVIRKYAGKLKVVVGQQELTMLDPNEETISVFQIHVIDRYNSTNQFNDVALIQVNIVWKE